MKIAFNPSTVAALTAPPNNKNITFDLRGHNIFARGVKFCGTDTNTWRDIKINNVSIGSNILDLRNGSNTTLTNTNGVVTINSTWRPVVDNLTSDSTTSSLSANQGRILKALIDGKSDSGHIHDDRYLKLTGGTMSGPLKWANNTALPEQTSPKYFVCIDAFADGGTTKWASKTNTLKALTGLTSTAIGDSDEPVYWNGTTFVKANTYPTKASWNYDDVYSKKYYYSLPPQKCVKINYSTYAPVIISACRTNGGGQFLLVGLGYGADGWVRNQFRCLIPSSNFTWKLSADYNTIELYHNTSSSGNATVTVITTGNIVFTETNALSGSADTKRFACFDELTWTNIESKPATATRWPSWSEVTGKPSSFTPSSHTHPYLPLSGGTMSGTIYRNSGGTTISGRDHAIIRQTYAPGGPSWNPIACVDTETGTWTLGHLSSEDSNTNFHFCFSTNADYNAGNNNGNYVTLRNKVGTIALLSDIPSSLKNPYALTISLNGTSQGPYDGSAAKNINITPSSIGAATSGHTHDGRYLRWNGSTADISAMGWGTLTAANGYTILSHAASSDGGDMGFVSKGGQIFMQLDGYYYQKEGQYRVLDTSDFTVFSNIGNQTTRITIGGVTKDLKIDADTVDGYHATDGRTFTGNINWSENWNNVWSDGTHTHPWYGFDHRYPNTGIYSTTISDYYGLTLKTCNVYISMNRNGNVGIGYESPSYKLDVNGQMRASGFHHGSVNSDNYMLLAGGGYKSFGGDYSHPIFLGYLNLEHGNDGTISSSFSCLGYTVPFTYTRGGNYCRIYIPDTTYQTFYIRAAIASVNYSGGGMDTWVGDHRGEGAWWLHCYASGLNEVRVKGFCQRNSNNDSWWGGNPLWSGNSGANRITVCIFGNVTLR